MNSNSAPENTSPTGINPGQPSIKSWNIAFSLVTFIVLAHSYYRFSSWLMRPFWQDECRHNLAILASSSVTDLINRVGMMGQPALDYVIRMLVWFPLLGHQELGLRLPALIYYLIMIISGTVIAGKILKRGGHPFSYALFGALATGIWMTTKPMETWNACEARHYSLVSLLSLWWFYLTIFRDKPISAFWWILSALFVNTHFFALPLVMSACAIFAMEFLLKHRWKTAVLTIIGICVLIILTIKLNSPAWRELTSNPPGQRELQLSNLTAGLNNLWGFLRYIGLFITPIFIWLGLLMFDRRRDSNILLFFAILFVPLFLFYIGIRSNYPFYNRYFTPFFGIAFASVVLGFDRGRHLFNTLLEKWGLKPRPAQLVRWFFLVIIFFSFKMGLAGMHVLRVREYVVKIPQNGSPTYHLYETVKQIDKPALLISEACWHQEMHNMYLNLLGTPFRHETRQLRSSSCGDSKKAIASAIDKFFKDYPDGQVLLDGTHVEHPCYNASLPKARNGAVVIKAGENTCAWHIKNARTSNNLRRTIRELGFLPLEWWYKI